MTHFTGSCLPPCAGVLTGRHAAQPWLFPLPLGHVSGPIPPPPHGTPYCPHVNVAEQRSIIEDYDVSPALWQATKEDGSFSFFPVNFVNFGIHKPSTLIRAQTHSCDRGTGKGWRGRKGERKTEREGGRGRQRGGSLHPCAHTVCRTELLQHIKELKDFTLKLWFFWHIINKYTSEILLVVLVCMFTEQGDIV